MAIIEQFRDDPSHHVMLMSYGAGSVGLNLQFCGYVFLFDRWWNPAVEDQAINRAHRIGAHGPVTVTRMLTLGTIEERIHQVLEEKRQLFDTVFSETECPTSLGLTQEDVFGLFDLKLPTAGKRPADFDRHPPPTGGLILTRSLLARLGLSCSHAVRIRELLGIPRRLSV